MSPSGAKRGLFIFQYNEDNVSLQSNGTGLLTAHYKRLEFPEIVVSHLKHSLHVRTTSCLSALSHRNLGLGNHYKKKKKSHTLVTNFATGNRLSFVSKPRISCLLPATIKCQ